MALVTLSGVISAADLNTNFSDEVANLNAYPLLVTQQCVFSHNVYNLASDATDDEYLTFTPDDLVELVGMRIEAHEDTSKATTATVTATLTSETTPDEFFGSPPSVSVTAPATTTPAVAGKSYETQTGPRHFLLPGHTYKLVLSSDKDAATRDIDRATGSVVVRYVRRRGGVR